MDFIIHGFPKPVVSAPHEPSKAPPPWSSKHPPEVSTAVLKSLPEDYRAHKTHGFHHPRVFLSTGGPGMEPLQITQDSLYFFSLVLHSIQGLHRQANLNHHFSMGFYNMFCGKDSQNSHFTRCSFLSVVISADCLPQANVYQAWSGPQGCSLFFAGWPSHTLLRSLTVVAHQLRSNSVLPQKVTATCQPGILSLIQNENMVVHTYLFRQYSSSTIRPQLLPLHLLFHSVPYYILKFKKQQRWVVTPHKHQCTAWCNCWLALIRLVFVSLVPGTNFPCYGNATVLWSHKVPRGSGTALKENQHNLGFSILYVAVK